MPYLRQSSAILCSPRIPSIMMRTFCSEVKIRFVLRRISFNKDSEELSLDEDKFFLVVIVQMILKPKLNLRLCCALLFDNIQELYHMVYYYVAIEGLANIYIIFVKRYTEMWQECVMPDSEVYEDRGYNLFLPKIKRISAKQLNHQNDNKSP